MMLLQWPCFWAWTGVKFPHSQYACHSSKRMHQQHHVFKTLYILICGKIYRKHSLSQTWKVYLSTNLSIQNSIPSNASLCFPSHLPSCVDLAGCSGNRITVLPHGCNRSVEAGISPQMAGENWTMKWYRHWWHFCTVCISWYLYTYIYIHIYIWYMVCPLGFVGSEWILLGVSKWSDLESRFRLGVTIPWVFSLKTRISPTIHVTISMSWHCRMDIVGWDELL